MAMNPPRPACSPAANGRFYTARDGTKIFVFTRLPDAAWDRTVYVLSGITGINHEREADLVAALSGGTNRIVVIHPRGTGYSEGARGDLTSFDEVLEDHVEIVNADAESGERILFGHSMSTALAVAIAPRVERLAGVVLVNPPVATKASEGMTPGIFAYAKYALYMIFAPHVPVVNMAGNPAQINDPEERAEAEARKGDPLLVHYFSMLCMLASKRLMDSMVTRARTSKAPLLLVYGAKDSIVERRGCERLFDAWACVDKRFLSIADGPHGKRTALEAAPTIREWARSRPRASGTPGAIVCRAANSRPPK